MKIKSILKIATTVLLSFMVASCMDFVSDDVKNTLNTLNGASGEQTPIGGTTTNNGTQTSGGGSEQTPGGGELAVITDPLLNNKIIDNAELAKTDEVAVITTATTVHMKNDSAWSGYYSGYDSKYKGVFIKDRSVTLSPYAIGRYEVTQELFEKVMGTNPSNCVETSTAYKMLPGETQKLRPVDSVNWYQAIAFCNKLSILCGLEPCYEVSGITDWEKLAFTSIPASSSDATWNAVTCDFKKNGYRLPTEAEWEFAARGGDPSKPAWKYSYAGVNTYKMPPSFKNTPYYDYKLDDYGWYAYNLAGGESSANSEISSGIVGYGSHEVGKKNPNTLGLYDMSGNEYEWCWDWSGAVDTTAVTDPAGPASGTNRIRRGGSWTSRYSDLCAVSYRLTDLPYYNRSGFRLARSL